MMLAFHTTCWMVSDVPTRNISMPGESPMPVIQVMPIMSMVSDMCHLADVMDQVAKGMV
jgi:hypothetical protein